ncbi:MAG: class I SAM-dependent methyltransferase [Candidatus Binatia bacterium]|nr:class I SAM-dependent methyltransferase [Candidatus Binatia bacterium]
MRDLRDEYIGRVVRGKSFADVGGLWGAVNEKVSVAHAYGASALAMIDITPLGQELWHLFESRRQALQLPAVWCISDDVLRLAETASCPQFDVVHCSGLLYHMPDPLRFLQALRKMTREFLVLTSVVTAPCVRNEHGELRLPAAAALFIPALRSQERAILHAYWSRFVGDGALGVTREVTTWRPDDYAPWWWLPTVEALQAMCRAVGFAQQEGGYFWNNNAYVQLLSVQTEVWGDRESGG